MIKATRRPWAREMAPVGSVPAASPSTNIESGTVASEISGASVAPTIDPVAKITAEFAPVSAWAAARRITLARARPSSEISLTVLMSIINCFRRDGPATIRLHRFLGHYGARPPLDQPTQTERRHASRLRRFRALENQEQVVGRHLDDFGEGETGRR